MKMSASHEKSPTELTSGSTQATEAAVLFPSVFGCQFVQLWPVGRCQNETRNVLGLIQNGPCQVDQISSQSEGGHLTGTQAEGKWIPQDFHVPPFRQQPPSSGGYYLSEGVVGDGVSKI